MSMAALQYLDFDVSEDEHGVGSFDAMASVLPAQVPALHAELTQVLAWAHDAFARGPLDEGFDWDYDLQLAEASAAQGTIGFDASTRSLWMDVRPGATPANPAVRCTLTLTLSGTPAFCAALREAFDLDS